MGIESEGVSTQEADIAVIGGHRRPPTADEVRFGVGRRAGRRGSKLARHVLTPQMRHDSTDAPARVGERGGDRRDGVVMRYR